jgi:hypothetical protein
VIVDGSLLGQREAGDLDAPELGEGGSRPAAVELVGEGVEDLGEDDVWHLQRGAAEEGVEMVGLGGVGAVEVVEPDEGVNEDAPRAPVSPPALPAPPASSASPSASRRQQLPPSAEDFPIRALASVRAGFQPEESPRPVPRSRRRRRLRQRVAAPAETTASPTAERRPAFRISFVWWTRSSGVGS